MPFMTTYRRADGEPILDYDFVLHEEFFEDLDEPIDLIVEVWQVIETRPLTIKPTWWDEAQEDE